MKDASSQRVEREVNAIVADDVRIDTLISDTMVNGRTNSAKDKLFFAHAARAAGLQQTKTRGLGEGSCDLILLPRNMLLMRSLSDAIR